MAKRKRQTKQTKKEVDPGKVIFYFIEQKLLEIIGIGLFMWMLYLLGYWNPLNLSWNGDPIGTGIIERLGCGCLYLFLLFTSMLIIAIIYKMAEGICMANWEWVKERARK